MRTTPRPSLAFAVLASGGLALAAPPAGAAAQPSFDRVDAAIGSPTTATQARDLNGDGLLDLVVSGGHRVFVLTGHGDGRFEVTWSGAAGENPVDLAIADLDEDELADLAVANHETDHVTLLFGIAGGAFERRDHSIFRVGVSPHPHAVRLHDIDADGHADLLVDDRSPESIRLFRGRGDGTFSGATSIDVGGDPYRGMSLADVTGDGLADLIAPNPDHVAVLVARVDGGFRRQATLPAPFGPFSVAAADLNGDGRRDVAAASGEGAGLLATWHGLGDGSFGAAGRYELKAGDMLPPILPVTIYNGQARWRAATDISKLMAPVPPPLPRYLPRARYLLLDLQRIGERDPPSTDLVTSLGRMERQPSPENLRQVVRGLTGRFRGPGFDELRGALFSWVAGAAEAWQIPEEELARIQTATEDGTMYERVKEMREQVHRDGIEKGLQQGLQQGLEKGREHARAEGRALLGRLAARKFGARTAKQLSRVLEDIADPERLADVADAIIDCDSDVELFARVGM